MRSFAAFIAGGVTGLVARPYLQDAAQGLLVSALRSIEKTEREKEELEKLKAELAAAKAEAAAAKTELAESESETLASPPSQPTRIAG